MLDPALPYYPYYEDFRKFSWKHVVAVLLNLSLNTFPMSATKSVEPDIKLAHYQKTVFTVNFKQI